MAIAEGMQRFARFRYATTPARPAAAAATPQPLAMTRWELATLPPGSPLIRYPHDSSALSWRSVQADFDGLVDLTRHLGALQAEGRAVPAAARTFITQPGAGPARLVLAFCDRVAVYLNRRRVFVGTLPLLVEGDNPRIALRDTIPVQLSAGRNELLIVSTGQTYLFGEGNGGWGFAAHLLPGDPSRARRASRR
jgi:hypothetical protein